MTASRGSSDSTTSPSSFIRRLTVGILTINLFVIALAGLWLNHARTQDQEEAEIITRNLSQVLEQYIVGVVGKIDLALLTVVDEHQRLVAGGGVDARMLNELLARQQAHLPEVISLRMTDAHGTVKFGPGVAPGSSVNVADRDYFIRARDASESTLVVTKPVFARISKKWAIVLARRLNQPDGSFAGVVYVNLALEQLSKTFSSVAVGAHGLISLRDQELGLIARHPELGEPGSAIGQKIVSQKLHELIQAGQTSGTYIARAGTDGIERTFTFRKLPVPAYYIFVGVAPEDYLAEWRKGAVLVLALVALFVLTTLMSAWLLYRAWKRKMVAVAALAQEETRFRTLADYTYDWEYWQGENLEILYMTPSCERITGYSQAEFVADPGLLTRIIHPEDRHLMEEHLSDATTQDEAEVDFRIVRRDGGIRWIAHGCRAVYRPDGQFMGRRASNRDVTERKQAEALALTSEARLLEAQRIAQIGSWILDLVDGKLIWSDEIFRIFEIDQRVFGASYEAFLNAIHPEDRERVNQAYSDSVANHAPYEIAHRLLMADGRIKWVNERCETHYDETGKALHSTGTVQDITARKQAEEALELLNKTLDQRVNEEVAKNLDQERLLIQQSRLAAMGEMIGNIAHQWRQPLNALGLLLGNIKDANDYHELDTAMIDEQTAKGQQLINKMSSTIDDFRNFFKPNKAKENFGLTDAIDKTLDLIDHSLKNHSIAVHVASGEEIQINGFPNEFSQVLLNVFNNAKDALLERKVAGGRIDVSLGRDDKTAWVAIQDNAGGIADDTLPKIFDPYFTTKEKGTGIGLYMSKMIMEHMDGTIEVRNLGDGAEFRLVLPHASQRTSS